MSFDDVCIPGWVRVGIAREELEKKKKKEREKIIIKKETF